MVVNGELKGIQSKFKRYCDHESSFQKKREKCHCGGHAAGEVHMVPPKIITSNQSKNIGYQSVQNNSKNIERLEQRRSSFLQNIQLLNKRTEFFKDIILRNTYFLPQNHNNNQIKSTQLKGCYQKYCNVKTTAKYLHHYNNTENIRRAQSTNKVESPVNFKSMKKFTKLHKKQFVKLSKEYLESLSPKKSAHSTQIFRKTLRQKIFDSNPKIPANMVKRKAEKKNYMQIQNIIQNLAFKAANEI